MSHRSTVWRGARLRALWVDQLASFLRIAFGKQLLGRDLCKSRIGNPMVAIGERQL